MCDEADYYICVVLRYALLRWAHFYVDMRKLIDLRQVFQGDSLRLIKGNYKVKVLYCDTSTLRRMG